ncbi:MAG: redoxin domain-containing protein [Thermoflexibacter sp.]|jgi:peroxiredoxin|nr:redoxin domain-containing protein [Thermoflexibacter sp.]
MEKLFLCLCFVLLANLNFAQESNVTLAPQFPQAGKKVEISYTPVKALENAKTLSCEIYFTRKDELIASEINLTQSNDVWKGTFQVPDTVQSMIFVFVDGDKKDYNGTEWYTSLVYDANQKPIDNAYGSLATAYSRWYYLINGDSENPNKIMDLYEKEFALYPAKKDSIPYLWGYFRALKEVKKEQANETIAQILSVVETKKDLDETTLGFLQGNYERLGNKEKAEMYGKLMKEKFPLGTNAQWESYNKIREAEDYDKAKALAEDFKNKFPKSRYVEFIGDMLIDKALKAKRMDVFEELTKNKTIDNLAFMYNNIAWEAAEKGEDLDKAVALSWKATSWAKDRLDKPVDMSKKPSYMTEKAYKEENKGTYAMFADTYGYILYQQGKYEEAYQYMKEVVAIKKRKDAGYNERYALALAKSKDNASLKPELEAFVKDGEASAKMKEMLKEIYLKEKGSDKGWTAYIGELEKESKAKVKAELRKKLIKEKAPDFMLKNLKEESVSLASMKGKVVIVDFWATWCGPCIASFPGMQKAVDKFKEDKNVAFLFVDTWENVKDKKQNASDFINKKKYTFNVLMDNENTVVTSFGVSGIPTKFIIDKNGDIRFKSVGFSGNADAVADEISMMIEMINEETK